jgi:ABC-type sugar transport system ATPase subunit
MIETRALTIRNGGFLLSDISFQVPKGKYCVLMGKTGCGKTTLLESICGLKQVVSGSIFLGEREVTRLKPAQREIGLVPQDGSLFPSMTVREHLEFALVIRRWPKARMAERVSYLAEMLQLSDLLERRPGQLSGGERQRVALGRALSFKPHILCLDEPLSALDDDTREEMIALLKRVQQQVGVTALHVTHNRHEAERLADVHLYLAAGQLTNWNGNEPIPPRCVREGSTTPKPAQ